MPLTLTRGSHPASAHTRVIVTVSYVILLALVLIRSLRVLLFSSHTALLLMSVLLSCTYCMYDGSRQIKNLFTSSYMSQAAESLHRCSWGLSALLQGTSAVFVHVERNTFHAVLGAGFSALFGLKLPALRWVA